MEKVTKFCPYTSEFLRARIPDPPLKTHNGDRLELLQMEHAILEKPLGDRHLPAVVANGCRVRNDNDERELHRLSDSR